MTGNDIRESMRMAGDSMAGVQSEIRSLAKEGQMQYLTGDERKQFFRGMTQPEFDTLHSLATAMGDKGRNALERLLKEAEDMGSED